MSAGTDAAGMERFSALAERPGEPGWLSELRKESLRRFAESPREFGKYTRLRLDWASLPEASPLFAAPAFEVEGAAPVELGSPRATLLSRAVRGDGEIFKAPPGAPTAWDHLVLAGWREGLHMRWEAGERDGAVPHLTLGSEGGLVLEPLVLDVRERAEASLFLHWRGGEQPSLHLSTLLGSVGDGARLKVFLLHEGRGSHHHLSASFDLGRDAEVEVFCAWMGGRWSVGRMAGDMSSPGSRWKESHMVVASGREHLDLDSQVRHGGPNTSSDVQVKTMAAGSSRTIFTGNILMEKEANLAEAHLSDHVLLLSPEARADSIPGLEIKAMDVKAAHAASVGQVDEDQLLYLMSRGLDPARARHLIVVGFLESLLMRSPFRFAGEILDPLLEEKVVE
jgi:hypothetical protein